MHSEKMILELPMELRQRLIALADRASSTPEALALAMLEDYADDDVRISQAVKDGLEHFQQGQVVSHKHVLHQLDVLLSGGVQ